MIRCRSTMAMNVNGNIKVTGSIDVNSALGDIGWLP